MAQPPVTLASTARRSPAQVEDDRLQLTYFFRDALMRRRGFAEQQATEAAEACVTALATLDGNEIAAALSKFRREARRQRDTRIRAELRTGNAADLARREGLSVSQIYEIAARRPSA